MVQDHRTRVFKTGNSLAVRLPRWLGLVEGDEVVIVPHADGSLSVWKADQSRAAFMSLYGSMSPGFMADGRDNSDQDERDWSVPDSPARAA